MKRRKYTREFKIEAVKLSMESGRPIKEVAIDLGINPNTLYKWRAALAEDGDEAFPGHGKMKAGEGLTSGHFVFLGVGVIATVLMTFLRHRLPWWRLHPIGFSIASVGQVRWTMLSLFAAWVAKVSLIRFGGLILYNRAKPFFIGLVVGHFTTAGLSFIVDVIWFSGQGHSLYL